MHYLGYSTTKECIKCHSIRQWHSFSVPPTSYVHLLTITQVCGSPRVQECWYWWYWWHHSKIHTHFGLHYIWQAFWMVSRHTWHCFHGEEHGNRLWILPRTVGRASIATKNQKESHFFEYFAIFSIRKEPKIIWLVQIWSPEKCASNGIQFPFLDIT